MIADFPQVKSHVLSWRGAIYNPLTLVWSQPTGYLFVRPSPADYLMGRRDYEYGADENTFMVELSTFDYEDNSEEKFRYEYTANCSAKLYSTSGPNSDGIMVWFKTNEPMGNWDYARYCEANYEPEFNIMKCIREVLKNKSGEVREADVVVAAQQCAK